MKLFKLQDFSDPAKQTAIAEFAAKKYGRAIAPERIGVIARGRSDLEVIDLDDYESPAGYAKTLGAQAVAGIPSTVAAGLAFPVGGLASGLASSPTGPLAIGLGLAGGTVAAGAAGYAAEEATQAGLRKLAPSAARELENQRLINPKTATLAQIASGFGLAKNLPMGFRKLVGERLGKEAAEVTGKDIAKIIGSEVGVNVAAEAGTELAVEGDLDPMRLGAAALGAPVQLRQTRMGKGVTTAGERLAGRIAPQTARKLGYASNPELPNEQGLSIPDSAADRNAAIDELFAAGDVDQAKAREFYRRIMRAPLPDDANVELPALRRVAEDSANKRRLNDPGVRSEIAAKAYDAMQAGADPASLPDYPFLRTLVTEYGKDKTISREQFVAAARNENVQAGLQAAREKNIPVVAKQAAEAKQNEVELAALKTRQAEEAAGGDWLEQLADQSRRLEASKAIYNAVKTDAEDIVLPTDPFSRKLAGAIKEGTIANAKELEQVALIGRNSKLLEDELNKLRIIRLQERGTMAAGQLPTKQPGQVMSADILGRTAQRLNLGAVGTPGTKASPPVPESKEQVQAQVDLTANPKSAKAVTVLDAGSPMPANVPDGLDVQASGGRVVISNPKQISKEAAAVVGAQDIVPQAPLGQSTKEVAAPSAVAVTTSTPTTKDVVSTLVNTQAEIDAAKKAQQAAVPGGVPQVKSAAEVVENRLPASFDKAEADRVAAELQAKAIRYSELVEQGQGQAPEAVALRTELDAATRAQQEARAREVRAGVPVSQPISQPVQPAKQKRAKATAEKPAAKTSIEPATLTSDIIAKLLDDVDPLAFKFVKSGSGELAPEGLKTIKVPGGEILYNPEKNKNIEDLVRKHQNMLLNSGEPEVKQFSLSAPVRSSFELVDKLVGGAYRNWTRSVLDGLRALKDPRGAKTAQAHEQSHNYATTKYAADYLDYKKAFDGLSPQDKGAINQYLFQMKYHGFSPMVLPPRLANRVDAIRAVLQRQIYDRYAAGGPYVNDGRMPDMDLNYVPETISKEALNVINAGDSPRYQTLKQDFLAHKVNMGHSHDEAAEMWANMVKAYQRGSEMSEPTYNAVRKIEGSGLPASMRAPLEEALFKHSAMTHKDVAWFKFFQQDPEVAQFLGLRDDGKGGEIPLNDPSPEPVAEVFMKNATSWRNYNKTWMDAIGRLASAGRLGTVTGARDFFMTVPNLGAYLDVQDMPSVARAFSKLFTNNTEAAIRAGAINPEKVQGQDISNLAPGTQAMEMVERLSDVLRKYQGRELFEAKGRQMAFELGRIVAADRLQAGYNPQWFNRLFGDNSWKTLSKSELLDAVGRKFVEKAQGNYGMQGLPGYLLDGTSSPFSKLFLKLARFQVERFNNWYKDAWTPAVKGETYAPLLKSIMGGLVGAGAMNELLGALGIKPNAMLPSELAKMGNPGNKELAYTIFSYLDTAGTIGVLGNLIYSGLQVASGEIPRTVAVSLGIDSLLNAVARLHQFGKALDDGAESPEAWAKLAGAIARDNIQLFRTVSNAMKDRNMAREERIYKRQTGQLRTTSAQMLDDPFDPTKDLESAESEQEALAALPGVARKMQATGVVPVIRSPLRSLEVNPLAPNRPNFYQWLERAQGTPVAQAQGEKDLRGQEMARGKNQLIGMARQELINRAAEMQRLRDMQRVMEP